MVWLLIAVLGGLIAAFALWGRLRQRRFLQTVEVVVLRDVAATQLGNRRDVRVFLPPGYHNGNAAYDVLYINDGQEHEALGLRGTLAHLTAGRRIRPIIAVAIPTNDDRLHEYGTAIAPNRAGLGSRAAAYTHFVTEELMPLVDATFRTRPGAAIMGVSLGGLSAWDIAWNHPERFAMVGVMSGSFWWRAADDETRIDPGERIAHSQVKQAAAPPLLRFWFQAGTRDEVSDQDGNGVIDAIQDTLELMDELRRAGVPAGDMAYVEVDGGRHDFETWARVLPGFLVWAFGGIERG
jgi:enterochelin esterase-like enzyme